MSCCSRTEQAVVSLSSACDLVTAIALGKCIPKEGTSAPAKSRIDPANPLQGSAFVYVVVQLKQLGFR